MTARIPLFACALAAALPAATLAQEAAPQLQEDPRAAKFHEVERGFFVGFEAGYLGLLKTPVAVPGKYAYLPKDGGGASGGFSGGLDVGYDITPELALSLFFLGTNQSASASYGSFDFFSGGLDARYSFYKLRDRYQVERVHFFAHARGGYLRSYPDGLFGSYADSGIFRRSDLLLGGGLGVEYFTRLRHFSVGVSVDGLYVLHAAVGGFEVLPSMRYTF